MSQRNKQKRIDRRNRAKWPSPIFHQDDKWWWWDETWTHATGPFDTRREATLSLRQYVKEELSA